MIRHTGEGESPVCPRSSAQASTIAVDRLRIDCLVKPLLGRRKVGELRRSDVDRFMAESARVLKPGGLLAVFDNIVPGSGLKGKKAILVGANGGTGPEDRSAGTDDLLPR